MKYKNPFPTADIIIELKDRGIVLIKRKNPPYGWAIPGGFVEYGESMEQTAVREAKEETGLDISLICQLHTYSAPDRDPRHHTITTVFVAQADGEPKADDDAAEVGIFKEDNLPDDIAFDHRRILADYFLLKKEGFYECNLEKGCSWSWKGWGCENSG
ncbi:MAG: NUDIX hydrolase [Candidatus Desantisbacteria bacterium]